MDNLIGRQKIFTNYNKVNDKNIVEILNNAYPLHELNIAEEDFLYNYLKGVQPILKREKKVRKEINNKIVENHALSIVEFKTGYLLEKPIQYVATSNSVDDVSIAKFNGFMNIESKDSKDMRIATDCAICGLGYRLIVPNKSYSEKVEDESPFRIHTIKPQNAFIIYSSDIGEEALIGVVIYKYKDADTQQQKIRLQAYTKDFFYTMNFGETSFTKKANNYGVIPLIEYCYNEERMGAFEPVIPLLDAINMVQSNRVDGVEQFIQALLVFKNVDIKKEQLTELLELGAIKIKDNGEIEANVEYLTQELNQTQVQTLKDDMLRVVYKIVGMPIQNSGNGGDNGLAVVYKDGWTEVESKTQKTELIFKESERYFLKLALQYFRTLTLNKYKLSLIDIEIKFTRRNFENAWSKAQALDLLLKNPHIHPRLAFIYSGISADPEADYNESEKYYQEQLEKQQKQAPKGDDPNGLQN